MDGFTTTFTGTPFDPAVTRTIAALEGECECEGECEGEGFGVLGDIDVQGAMKDRPGVQLAPCRSFGACKPMRAHPALQALHRRPSLQHRARHVRLCGQPGGDAVPVRRPDPGRGCMGAADRDVRADSPAVQAGTGRSVHDRGACHGERQPACRRGPASADHGPFAPPMAAPRDLRTVPEVCDRHRGRRRAGIGGASTAS